MSDFDFETFAKNVRRYVAQGSGLALKHVLEAEKPDAPVPDVPFATVRLIDDYQRGYVASDTRDGQGDGTVTQQQQFKRAVWSVQFYRGGAMARAHRFVAWMQSPFSQEYEGEYVFSPQPPFVIRDLAALIADDWESRAGVDLSLDYTADYRYDTGRILTANDLTVDATQE